MFRLGTTVYNNYTIAISTENKETVSPEGIYYVNLGADEKPHGSYHRIWCEKLNGGETIKGVSKINLDSDENYKNIPACYYCIVHGSDPSFEFLEKYEPKELFGYNKDKRKVAYYNALATEKLNLPKLSEFISGSEKITR